LKERSKAVVTLAGILCVAGYVFVYASHRAEVPIRSDGFSYYVYLPSWFLFHDSTLRDVARDCCGGEFPAFTAIIRWPETRRWVNAHPIGVALLQTPFFVAAHGLTRWSNLTPDGFSFYYQHAIGLSGVFWTIAGLIVLRDLLRRHVSDAIAAATLLAVLFGTNLYHYATYDSSYSHVYSFFLFAFFLNLTERWHAQPSRRLSVLLGVAGGLIVLTRHTNVLFLIIFPLYGVIDRATLRARWQQLMTHRREVLVMALVGLLTIAPQLAIYYQATNQVLVSSYGTLGFNFASPRLFGVLFSVQKGVFFWSPLLLIALAGLLFGRGMSRDVRLPGLLFLGANTYLIASWWDWQFGGSYGHRGFVDSLPLFAVGLAGFFAWASRSATARNVTAVCVAAAIALSIVQMIQYWNGVIPISDTTWQQYQSVFLRMR
jgi:hypothetical protein